MSIGMFLEPVAPIVPQQPRDPRGRRHTIKTVTLARTLHADGWTMTEILRHLTAAGTPVTWNTLQGWLDPVYAERTREENKARHLRRRRLGRPLLPDMNRWHAAGVDCGAISRLLRVECGVEMSVGMVRYYLRAQREPRPSAKRKAVAA